VISLEDMRIIVLGQYVRDAVVAVAVAAAVVVMNVTTSKNGAQLNEYRYDSNNECSFTPTSCVCQYYHIHLYTLHYQYSLSLVVTKTGAADG
jgi:hypothetical protein